MKKATKTKRIVQADVADPDHAHCKALGQLLDRIGDKWTGMVAGALSKGPMRFNARLRLIDGVSHRMLTLTLREGAKRVVGARGGVSLQRATVPPRSTPARW